MSDERFRKYQRAVDEGDTDALPNLITEAVRTHTPIYRYAGRILTNINDDVSRALEQGGLVNVQYYAGTNISNLLRSMNISGKVMPSLELQLINDAIVKPPGHEYSCAVKASCFWSEVFDCLFLLRETPILHLARGAQIGTFNISPYASRASADVDKPAQERAVLVHGTKTPDTPGMFFGLERNALTISDFRKDGIIHPLSIHVGTSRSPYVLYSATDQNLKIIPLVTKRAEHILGNPNTFDFEAIK